MAMKYEFTLKFCLPDDAGDVAALVERLGAAGCDDALVGLGISGRIALEFIRDGSSASDAMLSALADVRRAIPTAQLIEAAPDFVGLSDVADRIGVTRQNMRKLMMGSQTFPAPVHQGNAGVWHLAEILSWLDAKGGYQILPGIIEVAQTAMQLNFVKQARQQAAGIPKEIWELTA
jgi:predicted DNA-binding transcriptional regulator AlpA